MRPLILVVINLSPSLQPSKVEMVPNSLICVNFIFSPVLTCAAFTISDGLNPSQRLQHAINGFITWVNRSRTVTERMSCAAAWG